MAIIVCLCLSLQIAEGLLPYDLNNLEDLKKKISDFWFAQFYLLVKMGVMNSQLFI